MQVCRAQRAPAVRDLFGYVPMSVVAVAHDLPWKSGVGGPCGRGAAGWASIGVEKAWLLVVGCCSLVSFSLPRTRLVPAHSVGVSYTTRF